MYVVDIDKLVNSNNPDDMLVYRYPDANGNKRLVGLHKVLFSYNDSPTKTFTQYVDTEGTPSTADDKKIIGTIHTSDNNWEIIDNLEYKKSSNTDSFVARGCFPQFKTGKQISVGPGTYTLYFDGTKFVLGGANTTLKAEDFKDGMLPDRMLVVMCAGGGGGGYTNSANFAGAGGGSGAFFAVIINTQILKDGNLNYAHYYTFEVGAAGVKGEQGVSSLAMSGKPSSLKFHNGQTHVDYTLLQAGGGGGGGNIKQNEGGGAAGRVTDGAGHSLGTTDPNTGVRYEPQFLNSLIWWCPYANGRAWEDGKSGNNAGKDQPDYTETYINPRGYDLFSTWNLSYRDSEKFGLGNYHNGLRYASDKFCGGAGAASWFGNGGDGGWWAVKDDCNGKPGDGYGSGGGGASYYALSTINGAAGQPGRMWLFY